MKSSERLAWNIEDAASPDTIWEVLSPSEREKFLRALQDPTSEVAKELLASEELRRNIREPWWEDKRSRDEHGEAPEEPVMITIPVAMLKPVPNRPLLAYNLAAIWYVLDLSLFRVPVD